MKPLIGRAPALALGVLVSLALTGARAADKPYEGVTLNLASQNDQFAAVLAAIAPEFEAQTGAKVNVDILSYPELLTKITADYVGKAWRIGDMRIPFRLVVAFAVAAALTILLTLYLSKTFMGRAIRAVAQDQEALRLMGANPVRIKQWAFGIATAVLGIAGALLIIVAPVEPTLDRTYIGRTFCVVVMAGLGSMTGTLVAGIILGVAETIVLTLFGASWAPAISFGMLLCVLAVRPQGLFGRLS